MTNYKLLYNTVRVNVQAVPRGTSFRLRDLINDPPAGVGRILCQDVLSGKYPDVRRIGRDSESVIYEKM